MDEQCTAQCQEAQEQRAPQIQRGITQGILFPFTWPGLFGIESLRWEYEEKAHWKEQRKAHSFKVPRVVYQKRTWTLENVVRISLLEMGDKVRQEAC